MAESIDVTASGRVFILGGKEYTLYPYTDRQIIELEKWVRAYLVEKAFASLPDTLTVSERLDVRSNIAVTVSTISFADPKCARVLCSFEGIAKMILLGLHKDESKQAKELTIEKIIEAMRTSPTDLARWKEAFDEQNPNFRLKAKNREPTKPTSEANVQ